MKKLVAVLLVVVMLLSLCACGADTGEVNAALQGTWRGVTGAVTTQYKFGDGKFESSVVAAGISMGGNAGTYEITGSKIMLRFNDGRTDKIPYKFKNGTLTLNTLNLQKVN